MILTECNTRIELLVIFDYVIMGKPYRIMVSVFLEYLRGFSFVRFSAKVGILYGVRLDQFHSGKWKLKICKCSFFPSTKMVMDRQKFFNISMMPRCGCGWERDWIPCFTKTSSTLDPRAPKTSVYDILRVSLACICIFVNSENIYHVFNICRNSLSRVG